MAGGADGSVLIRFDMDVADADKELSKLKTKIQSLEGDISKSEQKRLPLVEQSRELAAVLDEAKAKLYEMQNAARGTYSSTDISEQRERVRMLQSEWNKVQGAVERYDQRIADSKIEITAATERAEELTAQINESAAGSSRIGTAMDGARKKMSKFIDKFKSVAVRQLMYRALSVVFRAFSSIGKWFYSAIKTNDEAVTAIAKLKGALLTMAQPIVEVVIPAFTKLVNILTSFISMISSISARLHGTTSKAASEAAEELYNEMEALEGTGSAAKKASQNLAAFDEINTLSTSDDSSGGSGNDTITPDFSSAINDEMDRIATLIGGALLALGAILTFSGVNIPLGITLMALGAATLASVVAVNWNKIAEALQGPLGAIMTVLSGALLALGAILALSGVNIPVGIALMAMGALGLVSVVAANWAKIAEALKGPLGLVTAILSGALLAVGAILAFSGVNILLGICLMALGAAGMVATVSANWSMISQYLKGPLGAIAVILGTEALVIGAILAFSGVNLPLGIALMAVGAAGLVSGVTANWDTISSLLQGPIGTVTGLISGALLVLGALLTFSGVSLPLGLGLLIVGAAGLVTTVTANWDFITETLGGPLNTILALVSGALLVLGIILLFTGVATPLGLGLLIAGASGLAAAIAPNWDFIVEKIKSAWESVKNFWNTHIAKVFKKEFWKDLAKKCGNGLIDGFEAGVNGIISMFEKMINWVVNGLNKISFTIPDWVPALGGKKFGFNLKTVSFGRVSIPRLAEGAVIPPNREFLAVLGDQRSGTNIETPLSTMVEAFKQAMAESDSGGTYTFVVNLDGREVARNTIRHMNDMTRERGKSVVLV